MDRTTPDVSETSDHAIVVGILGDRYAELGLPAPQVTWRFREDFFPEALSALGAATPDTGAARRAGCWCPTHARMSIVDLVFDHDPHGPPLDQRTRRDTPLRSVHPADTDDLMGTLWAFATSDPLLPVGADWRCHHLVRSEVLPWGWRWSQTPARADLFERLAVHADAWVCTPERVVLAAGWRTKDLTHLRIEPRPGAGDWPGPDAVSDRSPVPGADDWNERFAPDMRLPDVWHSAEELAVPGLRMATKAFVALGVGAVERRVPFADGGIVSRRHGGGWRSSIVGSAALRFMCHVLGLEQPTRLPGEAFVPDPDVLATAVLRSAHGPGSDSRFTVEIQRAQWAPTVE